MSARYPWWTGPAAWLAAGLFRALARTWRVDRRGVADVEAAIARGEGCLYALWHACLPALTLTHRDRGVATLISRHRDGELVARIVERLGYRTARGSSTRGGQGGLKGMIDFARAGRVLAVTPDGPRGPAGVVKPGLVAMASASGVPVWPIAAAARSTWVLRSWDRMRIPRPFARVVLQAGPALRIPPDLDAAGLESWRVRIEDAIRERTRATRAAAGEPAIPEPPAPRAATAATPAGGERA